MNAATNPVQRPLDAKLLALDESGRIQHLARADFPALLRPGDLLVANDAATLPASLFGRHRPTGERIEVRLASRSSIHPAAIRNFSAVIFGGGDFRTRTEDRTPPPAILAGDFLDLGPLTATVSGHLGHPRFLAIEFSGTVSEIWEGLSRHGRPIQYSHLPQALSIWDTWTPIAGQPVAFEPPSAGFLLDWQMIHKLTERGVRIVTLTHAAGISSTGDAELDSRLPFDEPFYIPETAARAIRQTRDRGSQIIAVGTTVVRALEQSAHNTGAPRAGYGMATLKIGPEVHLQTVDAILSGTHEPGSSHYDLLRAFADDKTLSQLSVELEAKKYHTHEFGDSVFLERMRSIRAAEKRYTKERSTFVDESMGRLCARVAYHRYLC